MSYRLNPNPRRILLVVTGQSNQQGAAYLEGGVVPSRYVSQYTGIRDPLPGCNNINQGGSCWPYLIDRGLERGVRFDVLNYAIGGASAFHYTGRLGASISGGADASVPGAQGYMSPYGLSGGTTALVEGNSNFDPFSLLSRTRASIAARNVGQYDAVVSFWANGESDAGESAAAYQGALESIANYLLASGSSAHFIGLTSKSASATTVQMDTLQTAVSAAVANLSGQSKRVLLGPDMYSYWGSSPPLCYEKNASTRVHWTLRGQEIHAQLLDGVLDAAGY